MSGQTTQVEYAKLLAGSTHGDALYIPTPHPEVGDVAHFDDGVYQQLFNIFSMTEERAAFFRIPKFPHDRSLQKIGFVYDVFCSQKIQITTLETKAEATSGMVKCKLLVKKDKTSTKVAICYPSSDLEVLTSFTNGQKEILKQWWDLCSHNIGVKDADRIEGPLFLVTGTTKAKQVSNCYYSGKGKETKITFTGKLVDKVKVGFQAGFSCSEEGGFNFKTCVPQPDTRWTLFINNEKIRDHCFQFVRKIRVLWHMMTYRKQDVKAPKHWGPPGQINSSTSATGAHKGIKNQGTQTNSTVNSLVTNRISEECIRISDIYTLYRTAEDRYYGEFHGSDLPDEVMLGNNAQCEEYAFRHIAESDVYKKRPTSTCDVSLAKKTPTLSATPARPSALNLRPETPVESSFKSPAFPKTPTSYAKSMGSMVRSFKGLDLSYASPLASAALAA